MAPSQLSIPTSAKSTPSRPATETDATETNATGTNRLSPLSSELLTGSTAMSFADVAHQTIIFDAQEEASAIVIELLNTAWVQRLRRLRQTGHANLVYMFAEHSRFGHSLGVAYLANRLMKNLARHSAAQVAPYRNAVVVAALMHDLGHVAPGSHLGEVIWGPAKNSTHEDVSIRVINEDEEIRSILTRYHQGLPELVTRILSEDPTLPPWTVEIISGGGWNADRGNWTIVDSTMASVSYGRYNVFALLDAYRLSPDGHLVIQENRLDALTHFFVARDSMYRQVYQHRVIQAVDAMAEKLVLRLRDLIRENNWATPAEVIAGFQNLNTFCDQVMAEAILSSDYARTMSLDALFLMTEGWWSYHVEHWCRSSEVIVQDLAKRLRDRRLLKTVRLNHDRTTETARRRKSKPQDANEVVSDNHPLVATAMEAAQSLGFNPRYYVLRVTNADKHRGKKEEIPSVILDTGEIVRADTVEPLIGEIMQRTENARTWVAVPKEVKEKLGRLR